MKKFNEWVDAIREAQINEASELQKSYQDYFKAKLDKYGAESPADLDDEKKKELASKFDWISGLKDKFSKQISDLNFLKAKQV